MLSTVSRFPEAPDRKRRAHAKSRRGCGNCKLRRVKCDETRPQCRKCISYGVSCNYDGKKATLDLRAQGSFQVDFSQSENPVDMTVPLQPSPSVSPVSINETMVAMVNESMEKEFKGDFGFWPQGTHWMYSQKDLEVFQRFQERTVKTIGTARGSPIYRDRISPMAFTYPFLMHMILSLTLLHDAHLASTSSDTSAQYTHSALQHWNTATVLFNRALFRPIAPESRDALWATAALIGVSVFAYVETPDATQSWPLRPSDPNDLDWIKLSEGKKAVWKIADPTRPDSVFNEMSKDHDYTLIPTWVRENNISAIPEDIRQLFDIDEKSTVKSNPYHLPTLILTQLQVLAPSHENVLNFLYLLGYMSADFRNLLEIKDPRALLLLGWWFKRLERGNIWWLKKRAEVASKGIHMWLENWFGGEEGLVTMFNSLGNSTSETKDKLEFRAAAAGWIRATDAENPLFKHSSLIRGQSVTVTTE